MMNVIAWEEFWWNDITGAHVMVSEVASALLDNRIAVLQVPSDLPWRHSMRSSVIMAFQERTDSRDIVIQTLDAVDDNPDNMEPGRFILQKFASSQITRGYRIKSRITIQDYIIQKEVIKNRIIWVKGIAGEMTQKWIEFCKGYYLKKASDGLFVLEIHEDCNIQEIRQFKIVNFCNHVSSYDLQMFNSFILDREEIYTDIWKKYIATVAALVCDVDAEISELLLSVTDFRSEDVYKGLERITEFVNFEKRGAEAGSKHVLGLFRNNEISEIQRRVWVAQIQVLFPVIELERVNIIESCQDIIQKALDSNSVQQYGEDLTNAIDVELGTLCYMMSCRKSDDSYMLHISDEIVRNRIRFLHECRNLLAHASVCSPEQVTELLDNTK